MSEHENCEAPWYCLGCEKPVCPRCEPSPAEFELCADCDWIASAGERPETNHPAEDPRTARWRCGAVGEGVDLGDLHMGGEVCKLPAEPRHEWHRSDSGNQWRAGGAA